MRIIKYLPVLLLAITAADAFGGDGTWPLRLSGDGTWPLRFNGESLSLQDPNSNTLATSLTIRSLSEAPLANGAAASAFTCSQTGDKHSASGSIEVGSTTFSIRGICYYERTDTIEVVSEVTVRQGRNTITTDSRMVGQVPGSADASDLFSGRLRVGEHATEHGRYKFDIFKVVRLPRNGGLAER